jgi:hypothetical protein
VNQPSAKLERRTRVLLRAYPAAYRRERGEEIIATLLEAAPPGQSFPSARDTWSLIAGGRHARAVRNRGLTTRANLRLALLLGLSIFLSSTFFLTSTAGFFTHSVPWVTLTVLAADAAAVLAPWQGSRAVTTALAFAAGVLTAYESLRPYPVSDIQLLALAGQLAALGALAVLSGCPQPLPRSWAWLPVTIAAAALVSDDGSAAQTGLILFDAVLVLAVVVVCWLVLDVRPALGLCIAVLVWFGWEGLSLFAEPGWVATDMLENLLLGSAVVLPVLLPAAWLLRRQAARRAAR